MADILLLCTREEGKDDFVRELIKGLMSRGLTVAYAGAYYSERKDRYVYDDVTNLLFFASTYFREARMKFKSFKTWEGFLDSIDLEQVDARLVIYAVMCERKIDFSLLKENFRSSLEKKWINMAVQLIRDSLEMDFSVFESYHPDIVQILGFTETLLSRLKSQLIGESEMRDGDKGKKEQFIGIREKWDKQWPDLFDRFIEKLIQLKKQPEGPKREKTVQELEILQEEMERECLKDPKVGEELTRDLFGEKIDAATEYRERSLFFDISRRIPKKRILCLYYEEEPEKAPDLHFYPEELIDEERGNSTEEMPRFSLSKQCNLKKPKDLYLPKNIDTIIDEHVMLALHPSLIDIRFPINGFMLEVDPEEPEIGFMSRKIDLENCRTREEALKVNTKLREKMTFYKYKEDKEKGGIGKLAKLESGDKKESQEEDLLILGRIEHLYRVLIADKRYGHIYQLTNSILKVLVFFAILYLVIDTYLSWITTEVLALVSLFLPSLAALLSAIFTFWTLRTFVLNYLLEPMYNTLKWSSYFFLVLALSLSTEFTIFSTILFITIVFEIILFSSYVSSAILHELNNSFKIMDSNDVLLTRYFDIEDNNGKVYFLRCGRFMTIVRKDSNVKTFLNSSLFPKIKYICKKFGNIPRKMAYSSGVFLGKRAVDIKRERVEELVYRKSRAWGFWGAVGNLLFGKGRIVPSVDPDSRPSSNDRFIYFGQWKQVMKHISNAIPVFPQLVLFRNMIIFAAFSGLLFNIFRMYEISLVKLLDWIRSIDSYDMIVYFILPVVWILFARRLKFRFWRAFLALAFFYLLLIQSCYIKALVVLSIFVGLYLLRFPIEQIYYSFRIWANEIRRGNLVSIANRREDLRGTRIKRDFLVTRMFMNHPNCLEEERIYFNKRFYWDIVQSEEWEKLREN